MLQLPTELLKQPIAVNVRVSICLIFRLRAVPLVKIGVQQPTFTARLDMPYIYTDTGQLAVLLGPNCQI